LLHPPGRCPAAIPIRKRTMNAKSTPSVRVAVVYHSGAGHTERQAQAVAHGANTVDDTQCLLIRVEDIGHYWDELELADAIIFGTPTYMGSASGQFKMFMDATGGRVFNGSKWRDKIAAGFTNAASRSGDKLNTLQQLSIFAAQHGMHWVNLGLHSGHNKSNTSENTLNRHGFFLGAAAQSDADASAGEGATAADLKTSEHLGRRVAMVARQMTAGRRLLAAA
jgi:NAD(P)H dehydrogenase (quinone)